MQVKSRNIRKTKCQSRGSDYTEKQVCKSQINISRRSVHSKKKKKKKKKKEAISKFLNWLETTIGTAMKHFKSSCKGGCFKVRIFLQIVSANM